VHFSVPVDRNCVPAPLPPPGLGVADGRSRRTARPSSRVLSGTRECRATIPHPGLREEWSSTRQLCRRAAAPGRLQGTTSWSATRLDSVDAVHRHRVGDGQVRRGRSSNTVARAMRDLRQPNQRRARRLPNVALAGARGGAAETTAHSASSSVGSVSRLDARAELAAVTRLVGAMARRRSRSCPGLGSR
jgi:hypothetical protein